MSKYYDDTRKVATIYSRLDTRPLTTPLESDEDTQPDREKAPRLPKKLRCWLKDRRMIEVALTDRTLVLGRKSRPEDPAVAVDFQNYEGYERGVSRYHAMIALISDKLTLQDVNSVNGTALNGTKLAPLQRYPLNDGDRVMLGNLTFTVEFVYD